jgi:hypothetical protein
MDLASLARRAPAKIADLRLVFITASAGRRSIGAPAVAPSDLSTNLQNVVPTPATASLAVVGIESPPQTPMAVEPDASQQDVMTALLSLQSPMAVEPGASQQDVSSGLLSLQSPMAVEPGASQQDVISGLLSLQSNKQASLPYSTSRVVEEEVLYNPYDPHKPNN